MKRSPIVWMLVGSLVGGCTKYAYYGYQYRFNQEFVGEEPEGQREEEGRGSLGEQARAGPHHVRAEGGEQARGQRPGRRRPARGQGGHEHAGQRAEQALPQLGRQG